MLSVIGNFYSQTFPGAQVGAGTGFDCVCMKMA